MFTVIGGFGCGLYTNLSVVSILTCMACVLLAAYKDLQSREDTRNGAWQQEGWDEVVYYTGTEEFGSLFLGLAYRMLNHINVTMILDCDNTWKLLFHVFSSSSHSAHGF